MQMCPHDVDAPWCQVSPPCIACCVFSRHLARAAFWGIQDAAFAHPTNLGNMQPPVMSDPAAQQTNLAAMMWQMQMAAPNPAAMMGGMLPSWPPAMPMVQPTLNVRVDGLKFEYQLTEDDVRKAPRWCHIPPSRRGSGQRPRRLRGQDPVDPGTRP